MVDPLYLGDRDTEPGVIPVNGIFVSPQTAEASTPLVTLGTRKCHDKGGGRAGGRGTRETQVAMAGPFCDGEGEISDASAEGVLTVTGEHSHACTAWTGPPPAATTPHPPPSLDISLPSHQDICRPSPNFSSVWTSSCHHPPILVLPSTHPRAAIRPSSCRHPP